MKNTININAVLGPKINIEVSTVNMESMDVVARRAKTDTINVIRYVFDKNGAYALPVTQPLGNSPRTKAYSPVVGEAFMPRLNKDLSITWTACEKATAEIVEIDVSHVVDRARGAVLMQAEYLAVGRSFFLIEESVLQRGQKHFVCLYGNEADAQGFALKNPRHFGGVQDNQGGQDFTASSIKDGWGALYENSNPARIHHMMDESTEGAFGLQEGKSLDTIAFVKEVSRFGQHSVTMEDLGPCTIEAILFGYFDHKKGKRGDGISFKTKGHSSHERLGMSKTFMYRIRPTNMRCIMKQYSDAEYIIRSEITEDVQKDLERRFKEHDGSMVVFIETTRQIGMTPEALLDMNAVKDVRDYRRTAHYYSMETYGNKKGSGMIKMSGQLLMKFLTADITYANRILKQNEEVATKAYSLVRDTLPSPAMLLDENMTAENVLGLADNAKEVFSYMMPGLLNSKAAQNKDIYNEFKLPTNGYMKTMVPDFSFVFGDTHLLKDVVVSDVYEDGDTVDGWRYPCVNVGAIKSYPVWSKKHAREVVENLPYGGWEKDTLKDMIADMPDSMVMTPTDETFSQRHDDSDWDTDTLVSKLTDADSSQFVVYTELEKKVITTRRTFKINAAAQAKYAALVWQINNLNIGEVTNLFVGFHKAYINKSWKKMESICVDVFGNTGRGKKDYESVLIPETDELGNVIYHVNKEKAEKAFAQLRTMKLTQKNYKLFLLDVMHGIDKFYQGATIDAVKKFYDVNIPGGHRLKRAITSSMKSKFEVFIEKGSVKLMGEGDRDKKDFITKLSFDMAIAHARAMDASLKELQKYPESFSEEMIDFAQKVWAQLSPAQQDGITVIARQLFMASSQYAKADKGESRSSSFEYNAQNQDEEAAKAASMAYKKLTGEIENMYRLLTYNLDQDARIGALIGYYLQAPEKMKGILRFIGRIICKTEMLHFAARFGGRDGALELVEKYVMPAKYDDSRMVVRVSTSVPAIAKQIVALHDQLVDGFGKDVISLVRDNNNHVHIVVNGNMSDVCIDTAGSKTLCLIYSTHNGTVSDVVMEKDTVSKDGKKYTSMVITLDNVIPNEDQAVKLGKKEVKRAHKRVAIKF